MIVRPSIPRLSYLASPQSCYPCWSRSAFTRPDRIQLCRPQPRFFSSRTPLREDSKPVNHYEVLGVKSDASKAELKKAFYTLSKATHPDLHKDDPNASERFSQISESYSVLGNDEKRRRYDRDFIRQEQASAGRSGTYAGSRPASGLSKRRGTFRGAPQSFYSQGGYGSTGRQTQNPQEAQSQAGTFNASAFTDRGKFDPEFNSDPIYRTQSVEDAKRAKRMQAAIDWEAAEMEAKDNFLIRFVVVTTIVVAGVVAGSLLVSMRNAPRGGLTRADGSRRDGPKNDWAKG